MPDGIRLTASERSEFGLPTPLLIVGDDGLGGWFVLDTSRTNLEGENPVGIWYHGPDKLEPWATDFGAFILAEVQQQLG